MTPYLSFYVLFLFFAALLTLIDGSFASLSIYQLSICLSTSSRKIIMFAASKHMDIYLSIALPMVSCTMSPLDLNNNFIKTTYDISLDSQISFLPLGFSPPGGGQELHRQLPKTGTKIGRR